MRWFTLTVLLVFSFAAYLAAQVPGFETFDRSGLPARGQSVEERELLRRISAHKRGDVAGAVEIQRRLAAYYGARGDDQRARAAQERVDAGVAFSGQPVDGRALPGSARVPIPARTHPRGNAGIGIPVLIQPAPPAETAAPAYGVPAPAPAAEEKPPAVPVYVADPAPGAEKPKASGTTNIPMYHPAAGAPPDAKDPAPQPEPAPLAAAVPGAVEQPAALSGEYLTVVGGVVHRWAFRPDGSFEHAWTTDGGRSGVAQFEAGVFTAQDGFVTLNVLRGSTGGRGADGVSTLRRLKMGTPRAEGGSLVLGGMVLRPKTQ